MATARIRCFCFSFDGFVSLLIARQCHSLIVVLLFVSHCIVSHMSLQQGGTLVGRFWSDSLDCSRFLFEEDKFTIAGDESFQRSRVVMMVFLFVVRRVFYIDSR